MPSPDFDLIYDEDRKRKFRKSSLHFFGHILFRAICIWMGSWRKENEREEHITDRPTVLYVHTLYVPETLLGRLGIIILIWKSMPHTCLERDTKNAPFPFFSIAGRPSSSIRILKRTFWWRNEWVKKVGTWSVDRWSVYRLTIILVCRGNSAERQKVPPRQRATRRFWCRRWIIHTTTRRVPTSFGLSEWV